jgi:phosphoribosylanthranilate isomerase
VTWVKVCGLKTIADIDAATEAGADAVGLVLIRESPRHLAIEIATELAAHSKVPTVILTRNISAAELVEMVDLVGAGGVQPYGDHATQAAAAIGATGRMVLWPMRVHGRPELSAIPEGQIPLLDGFSAKALGGSGTPVPDEWIPRGGPRFVLAGGLGPDNVAGVVTQYSPWGVDASSGLESSLGVKDPDRIRSFVERAKNS